MPSLLKPVGNGVPPMSATREEVDRALSILYDALSALGSAGRRNESVSKRKAKAGRAA